MQITADVKCRARINFSGSERLFSACWNQYLAWLRGAIDDPETQADVDQWLDQIASEKVNNPKSVFYIYG
jgi:hypothetical protein